MKQSLFLFVFIFLSFFAGNSQDFEVSFNSGEAIIDSLIATNLSSGESIKLPGNVSLILRKNTTGINSFHYEGDRISVIYPTDKKAAIIEYPSVIRQKISIQLLDISGKVVVLKDFSTDKGINRFTITAQQHGVYLVSILAGDKHVNTKVILTGQGNNSISYSGYKETENYGSPLKSITGDEYVLLFSTGDIISYEFYSGERTTIYNKKAGASAKLSPEFYRCSDYEGNSYSIVKIGEQWWMAENLRSTKYANGTECTLLVDNDRWSHLLPTEKTYCFYNNDESLNYGALYTHSAAIGHDVLPGQGICPDGWYLPGNDEWMELENFLIDNGFNYDGTSTDNKIGKSLASNSGWGNSDHIEGAVGNVQSTNNRTGFNAIPAGLRRETGVFENEGISGNWWSSTEDSVLTAETWYLEVNFSSLSHQSYHKLTGNSVRCIMHIRTSSIPNFIADKTDVSVGDLVTFTDLSSGEPTEWDWNFGDCTVSTEQNPSHIYTSPGTYTVSLDVRQGQSKEMKTDYIVVREGEKSTVNDTEDNQYKTIKIGKQWWMAENLRSTRYADGTEIPHITDNTEWGSLAADNTSKAFCYYNNDEGLGYGALYTYAAAVNGQPYDGSGDVQGICPDDWHVPAEAEWTELENYLIDNGYNYNGSTTGNKMSKSLASISGWTISSAEGAVGNNQATNNSSGFNGLPGGYRSYYSTSGEFAGAGDGGYWWMATDMFDETAMFWNLFYDYKHVLKDYTFKRTGLSVRCLKNDKASPKADFIADTSDVHLGGIVNFTDLSTNDPNKWIWNFGACGETSSEQNPSHHFTREGMHRVTLIAYNDNGYDVETKEGFINVIQRKSLVDDIEGNIYPTVEIGDQWWMAENLKSTKFNDGADIPLVTSDTDWLELTTPAYRWYDNDQAQYGNTYGAIYNWHTVNTDKLCPSGWHVPTDSDWKELETDLGMLPEDLNTTGERGSYIGSKLAGNADLWHREDLDIQYIVTNPHFGSSGFEALPGGSNFWNIMGHYDGVVGFEGYWWSSSEFDSSLAWFRAIGGGSISVTRSHIQKQSALSVRCVKD